MLVWRRRGVPIAEVAWERELDLAGELEDASAWDTEAAVVEVNGQLHWNSGPMIWNPVLSHLPELPPELEYRFVRNAMILFDPHAHLIPDYVERAFQ